MNYVTSQVLQIELSELRRRYDILVAENAKLESELEQATSAALDPDREALLLFLAAAETQGFTIQLVPR